MSSVCVLKLKVQFCTQRKRFEECAQNLTFHVGGAKASLWLRLCRKFVLQNVGGSEWVRSQKRLSAWQSKNWSGLHESGYSCFKVYAGTRNLKHVKIGKFIIHQLVDKLTLEPLVACAPFVV